MNTPLDLLPLVWLTLAPLILIGVVCAAGFLIPAASGSHVDPHDNPLAPSDEDDDEMLTDAQLCGACGGEHIDRASCGCPFGRHGDVPRSVW